VDGLPHGQREGDEPLLDDALPPVEGDDELLQQADEVLHEAEDEPPLEIDELRPKDDGPRPQEDDGPRPQVAGGLGGEQSGVASEELGEEVALAVVGVQRETVSKDRHISEII